MDQLKNVLEVEKLSVIYQDFGLFGKKTTYQALTDAIDQYNLTHFGGTKEELELSRLPVMIMF